MGKSISCGGGGGETAGRLLLKGCFEITELERFKDLDQVHCHNSKIQE